MTKPKTAMELQNLPTGQQDFTIIRGDNLTYVDKTMYALRLIEGKARYFFLSRPRRFGKSLFVNMLKEIFLGNKHHFKGLFIEDKIDWKTFPVLHFDFSLIRFKEEGLVKAVTNRLLQLAASYQVTLSAESMGGKFEELIVKLHEKTGEEVVILVDEYDKPITEYLEFGKEATEQRDLLRSFYGIIKGSSAHIRFFFLTGISRFGKLSIFSELNNLSDITFEKGYHDICGYTKAELETHFHMHLLAVAEDNGLPYDQLMADVKRWYNGYSWDGAGRVYNPFSILRFLDAKAFGNYWFESGTPKFLIKLLKPGFRYELNGTAADMGTFDSYDITNLNVDTLLFQTGYLTVIEKTKFGKFVLGYPNKEVEESLLRFMLMDYSNSHRGSVLATSLIEAVDENDMGKFIETINTLFASIPAEIFLPNREAYFHSILYISLKLCGFYIQSEVRQSKGRLDAVMRHENRLYIFEFKLDGTAEEAMRQIHEKGYAKPYQGQGLETYLVGINFSSEKKQVGGWLVERA